MSDKPLPLRIIPLGGLGEIGKNMTLFEYDNEGIIVDTGIMFPENDMLGIDYIIPDFRYIADRLDDDLTIHGIVITHGHEDHIGAIGHVLDAINAPVYATPLTGGLLEVKMVQAGHDHAVLNVFQAGDVLELGPFLVETFHVCHSIPDSVGLGIDTPVGLVVHSGDFKFDHTPVDGWPPDYAKLAEFSKRGVLALMSDSTNADRPGWTPSEATIDAGFDKVFHDAKGRIIVATFASLISRIQQVADAAQRYGRKMAVAGYSMTEYIKVASRLGYLNLPKDILINIEQAKKLPPREVVMMVTGSQGEPSAVLGRLANGNQRQFDLIPGDTVIMSAHPIPGNEELVQRTINKLIQRGANVIYDAIAPVHVSGHASQEELKLLINLIRPKFFIPVHGELRHLHRHAEIAQELGIPAENTCVVENGTEILLTADRMSAGERIPGGYVFVDGSGVGDIGPIVLRDRETLGRDGFLIAIVLIDKDTGQLVEAPEIISRGFVFLRDASELIESTQRLIEEIVDTHKRGSLLSNDIQDTLSKMFYNQTKRRPMVFAYVREV
ncbi:ribonuclease J [Aggregatilinea lenta]|uniref:ribonuclease J n=1 Tax=Aggregatilinea lenta TaxID=913108 RepID=UPI000E5A5CE2|nr:ribonuclease J [Aggregatilinea lenta]